MYSSSFSLNAKLDLFRKNINNLLLTQLLVHNEVLIKILRIGWLYKLSHLVDKNIKLCRYLSTLFYIVSIYIDILSTCNLSTNCYVIYTLHSISSILKSLSIMTYTSIRATTNLRICQILSSHTQRRSFDEVKVPSGEQISCSAESSHRVGSIDRVENNERAVDNNSKSGTNLPNVAEEEFMSVFSEESSQPRNNRLAESDNGKSKITNNSGSTDDTKNNLSYKQAKTFCIGEVSVVTDMLSSLVDLLTVVLLTRATQYIKQKLCFYVLLSFLHMFFSYMELHHLLRSTFPVHLTTFSMNTYESSSCMVHLMDVSFPFLFSLPPDRYMDNQCIVSKNWGTLKRTYTHIPQNWHYAMQTNTHTNTKEWQYGAHMSTSRGTMELIVVEPYSPKVGSDTPPGHNEKPVATIMLQNMIINSEEKYTCMESCGCDGKRNTFQYSCATTHMHAVKQKGLLWRKKNRIKLSFPTFPMGILSSIVESKLRIRALLRLSICAFHIAHIFKYCILNWEQCVVLLLVAQQESGIRVLYFSVHMHSKCYFRYVKLWRKGDTN
ncbi:conserved Plasmodium protein, unknown function [Plasmodium ovale wallikeri]|uniref:Uncharacterized protein n=1 Tax=Plasmodium ovale wallikeri TaxID=864142 RepID=A0A1A8Z2K6_PLAOA|nr:conserved Plasmodium protein, unknown function [Plasmodium ovale wallikeri]SBT38753.1 conserved Plasmodium protein, unknown function [Plasmodium ovale wallikeri]